MLLRSPVGAKDTSPNGSNSSASVMPSAWQMLANASMEGFAIPRSIAEMYVRSMCASKASVSWDLSAVWRHCLTRLPKAMEIGAGGAEEGAERRVTMALQLALLKTNKRRSKQVKFCSLYSSFSNELT